MKKPIAPIALLTPLMATTLFLSTSLLLSRSPFLSESTEPTRVIVRAIAHDAKAIGSGVGGARITITEAETGRVLAQGEQQGGSGDTERIMIQPRPRDGQVFDTPGAAHFVAELELHEPTLVEITAEGPLDTPETLYKTSKTMLLVPGQDVLGEGVILTVHGFRVTFADLPQAPLSVGEDISFRVKVVMV